MKNLKTFEQYSEPINEGWKENVLAGLFMMFGLAATGQTSKDRDKGYQYNQTVSKSTMKSLLKQGYTLDSTVVKIVLDELKVKSPETQIMATRLELSSDQFFASGKFQLNSDMMSDIENTVENILNTGGMILKIDIESSTDKQGLTTRLQDELKRLNYEPNNNGLSKARAESVSKYLSEEVQINDTLININTLAERGESNIDHSARYVTVDFYYVVVSESTKEGEEVNNKDRTTYYLKKDVALIKTKAISGKNKSQTKNMGTVNNLETKISDIKCYFKLP